MTDGPDAGLVAAVAGLALELGPLADLASWEPVGAVLEALPAAARGEGALDTREVERLRVWARRWRGVDLTVRAFYRAELLALAPGAEPGVIEAALWRILRAGEGAALTSRQMLALRLRFRDRYGRDTAMDLCPVAQGPKESR